MEETKFMELDEHPVRPILDALLTIGVFAIAMTPLVVWFVCKVMK